MKLATSLRAFSILAIISLSCLAAYADSDPRVIIRDPNGGTGVGENFSFTLPGSSQTPFVGDEDFYNATAQTWTSLTLFESGAAPGSVSCGTQAFFNDCQVYADIHNPSIGEIVFTNSVGFGPLLSGILPGESFDLNFSGDGNGNWMGGTSVNGVATTAVPEPATMAFLLTGIAAIATRRKLWKRASLSFLNTR